MSVQEARAREVSPLGMGREAGFVDLASGWVRAWEKATSCNDVDAGLLVTPMEYKSESNLRTAP